MEARTLLATMLWANAGNGDWDTAGNWTNTALATDHHVPTASDDAQINTGGITVTHSSNVSDSVNSLTVASGTTLSLSTGTLAIAATSIISGNLTMSGGTLSPAGSLTVSGPMTWTGGTIKGGGTTIADGGLTLGGTTTNTSYNEFLSGSTLENFGTATLATFFATQGLFLDTGATFNNEPGASFDITTNADIFSNGGSPGGGTFNNQGTFAKTGGTGTSVVGYNYGGGTVTFNETGSGTVQVQSGSLQFNQGGTLGGTGAVSVAGGTALIFSGGTFNIAAGTGIAGAGSVNFAGGTVNDPGSYNVSGNLSVTGGTANLSGAITNLGPGLSVTGGALNLTGSIPGSAYTFTSGITISGGTVNLSTGAAITASTLNQSGGTLTGTDVLTVTGATTWTGGTMSGNSVTNVEGGLTLGGTSTNVTYNELLSKRTLDNFGTATLATYFATQGLFLDTGATFNNEPGASFDITTNADIFSNGGSPGGGTFNNQGTFAKTGGTGTSVVGYNYGGGTVTFNETGSGTVQVQSGSLQFNQGGTLGGTGAVSVAGGTALIFSGGTFNIAAGTGIAGAGSVNFAGGTVNDPGSYNVSGNLSVTGGTANLSGAITNLGPGLSVTGGALNLTGSIPGSAYTFTSGISISGGTINSSTGAAITASTLNQSGGTLTGSDTITVTGATTWTGGTMSGSGVTIADGGLTLGGTSTNVTYNEALSARTLDSFGAATLATYFATQGLFLDTGATFNNEPGASFDITTNADIFSNGGSPGGGTFNNQGTFAKTGGTGTSVVGYNYGGGTVTFNETGSGTVQVQSGSLQFNQGGTLGGTGAVSVAGGTALIFSGGTFNIAAGTGIAGAGSVNFAGGTVNDPGSYNVSGNLSVTGGTANLSGAITNLGPGLSATGGALNLTGSIPGSAYTFTSGITISGGTVNLSTGAAITASTLNQSGGTLTGTDVLTVTGATTWTGGTMSGNSVTNVEGGLTLGGTTINVTYDESLSKRTLNNFGTATLATYFATQGLFLDTGATFNNEPGETFDITTDAEIFSNGGSPGGGTFNNQGTFAKIGGTGTSVVGYNYSGGTVTFNESGSGTVQVQSGSLQFNQGGTLGGTGAVSVADGTALIFSGGTFNIAAGTGIAGAGSVNFAGGTVNDPGSYNVSGNLSVTGGTANLSGAITNLGPGLSATGGALNLTGSIPGSAYTFTSGITISGGTINLSTGAAITASTLNQSGGTLTGTDVLTVTGATTWTGGTMSGNSVTNVEGGLTLGGTTINVTYDESLSKRTLNNFGTATLATYFATQGLFLDTGATFNNEPGASFDITTNADIFSNGGSPGGGTFNNQGTFAKTGGTGVSTVGYNYSGGTVAFNQTGNGTVQVQSGSLQFSTGGTFSNSELLSVAAGATLVFAGGTFNIAATSGIAGAGTVNFAGGTVNDLGSYNVSGTTATGGTANLQGSILNVGPSITASAGAINLTGPISGGAYSFPGGLTASGGTINFSTAVALTIPGGIAISGNGTINFHTGSAITTTTVTESGGTLASTDNLTISGATTWTGGTMSGGATTVADGGLTLGGTTTNTTFDEVLSATTLENFGTATLATYYTVQGLFLSGGATVVNEPGETFDIISDANILGNGGNPSGGTFNNQGTFAKTGGTGISTISYNYGGGSVAFNQSGSGTVQVQSGELQFNGGGTFNSSGLLSMAAGATLAFSGGTFAIAASSGIEGAGSVNFVGGTVNDAGPYSATATTASGGTGNLQGSILNLGPSITASGGAINLTGPISGGAYNFPGGLTASGGTINFSTAVALTIPGGIAISGNGTIDFHTGSPVTTSTLTQSGGTLASTDNLTISGATTWTGGTMSGGATTVADGGLTLGGTTTNTTFDEVLSATTLENFGTATLATYYTVQGLFLSGGATVVNEPGETFDIISDANILSNGGNPSGGTFNNQGTFAKTGGTGISTVSYNYGGGSVAFNQSGSGTVQVQSGELEFNGGGTFNSSGLLSMAAGATLAFSGGTFAIAASSGIEGAGSVNFVGGTVNDAGPYSATATTASGGTGNLQGSILNLGPSITASGGALNFTGPISGGAYNFPGGLTASGGTINFSTAVALTIPGGIAISGNGTIDFHTGSPVTTSTLTQSGGTLASTDNLTISGATTWTGGTMSGGATTVADGGLTLGGTTTNTSYNEVLSATTLENFGTATLATYYTVQGLFLAGGATVVNEPGESFDILSDANILSNGGNPSGGTFNNQGTFAKTGGTGISTVSYNYGGGTVVFNQTGGGTVLAQSGTLLFSGSGTFAGTVEATGGGTLTMNPAPKNLVSGTLTGGTWIVGAGSSMSLGANITTDAANIMLNGPGATLSSLSSLTKIASTGSLELQGGASFTTAGNLDDAGTIDLPAGTLNVKGAYTQESTGTYDVSIGGLSAGTQFGQLNVTGLGTLNGTLSVSLSNSYSPPSGDSYRILTFGSRSGDFSAEFGLFFGGGEGFVPTYDSAGLNLVVTAEEAGTSTSVGTSLNPSGFGQSVTFTATVTSTLPTNLTPTGNVIFFDGATELGSAPVLQGVATFPTSALPTGTDSIVAEYSGDSNFSGSNSTPFSQVVQQDASTTNTVSSANPSAWGQSVTFTATVASAVAGLGTPTGQVAFYDGATSIDTETLVNGSASYTTASLAVGGHSITAKYAGDTNFTGSTSSAIAQVVDQAATTTAITPGSISVSSGQPATFTATVSSTAGTPNGYVQFLVNGADYANPVLLSGGKGQQSIAEPTGSYTIAAQYIGYLNALLNGNFATGTFANWTVTPGTTGTTDIQVRSGSSYSPTGGYGASFAQYGSPSPPYDTISQNIATTPGATYTISYFLQNNGGPSNEFEAFWNGSRFQDIVNANAFSFVKYTFTETATSSVTTLSFSGYQEPEQFALTNITVTPNSNFATTLPGGETTGTLTVNAAALVSIAVTPANPSIAKGLTEPFTATGTYTDNSTQNLTSQVTWVSAITSVATINSAGLATAVGTGTSSISAALNGISGSTVLTVSAAVLASIAVTPANPSIAAGTKQQFAATGTYTDNSTQDLTSQVTWASATTSVATINSAGLATGVGAGTSNISAKFNGITGSTVLTVSAASLLSIAVTPGGPSIDKGLTEQFTATGTYSDNSTQNVTGLVTWSSDTTTVATITAGGLATGAGVGTSTIIASLNGVMGSTILTVTPAVLASIEITPANPSISKGQSQQFGATGIYTDSSTQILTSQVTWASLTTTVATITSAGLASGVAPGVAIISGKLDNVTGTTVLTVNPPALVSIAVTPTGPSIAKGLTQQFIATGTFSDNSTESLTSQVTWSSDNSSVATITSAGLATGAGVGTSHITAALNGISGSSVLTVTPAVLLSIAATPTNPSVAKGLTEQFTATGTYTDNSHADLTNQVTWASSNTTVATINASGLASAPGGRHDRDHRNPGQRGQPE